MSQNPAQTPLEQVQAEQARQAENREAAQMREENTPEVVGQGAPSDKKHFPHRQMYQGGNSSSESVDSN